MEPHIPFLSTAFLTDLELKRTKTEYTARLQRLFTPCSPSQTDRVQESKLRFLLSYPVGPCHRLASLWAAPGQHTLAYPHGGLALVCWMLTKGGRRWQVAHLLDSIPISFGPQRCPGVMGVVEEMREGDGERDRLGWGERYHSRHKANMQLRHFYPSLLPSLPFHDRGPAPALSKVQSMKACFLPFSTIGLFLASCFCSDRGVLPLSCADKPAKSCCGLLVQRGQINTGTKNTQTNWHQIVRALVWQSPTEMLHLPCYNPWTLDRNTEPVGSLTPEP